MNEANDPLILIAAIIGAFGVRGELRLKSFTDDPLACADYGPLLNQNGEKTLTPVKARNIKNGVALRTEEVTTPEEAQALKSTALYVRRSALPATQEEDEYYVSDLIGMDVKTADGKRVGVVKDIKDFGAGDVLEIQPPKGASWHHPFTLKDVPKVDLGKKLVIIIPQDILPDQTKEPETEQERAQ